MSKPRKITLAEARASGAVGLAFHCQNLADACSHSGDIELESAIARWGPHQRLDEIPASCSRCSERRVIDVRPVFAAHQPDGMLDTLILAALAQDHGAKG